MARDTAREGELSEQTLHALFVGRNVWIDLTVGRLEVGVRDKTGTAMPRAGDVDHVEVVLLDHPVQVNVDKVQAGRRSPVAEEPGLDVFFCERLFEQGIVVEINLTDGEVVSGPPVRIEQFPLFVRQRLSHSNLLVPLMPKPARRVASVKSS